MDRAEDTGAIPDTGFGRRDDVRVKPAVRIYIETGKTWSFAAAIDWPGWCRRGKSPEAAMEALAAYRDRYADAIGMRVPRSDFSEVGRLPGGSGTEFGVPSGIGPWDSEALPRSEPARGASILGACWSRFDAVAASAPAALRKGPRGGGRDRDKIVEHVRDAERAYGPRMGVKLPASDSWTDQRARILEQITSYPEDARWPLRYAVRRLAWHILDHTWEIQDRSE